MPLAQIVEQDAPIFKIKMAEMAVFTEGYFTFVYLKHTVYVEFDPYLSYNHAWCRRGVTKLFRNCEKK